MYQHIFFERSDITNATLGGAAITASYPGREMQMDGEALCLAVALSGDVGAAGDSYTVTLYIARWNGTGWNIVVPTSLEVTVAGAVGTQNQGEITTGGVTFSRRDLLMVHDQKAATPAAVAANITLLVRYDGRG